MGKLFALGLFDLFVALKQVRIWYYLGLSEVRFYDIEDRFGLVDHHKHDDFYLRHGHGL